MFVNQLVLRPSVVVLIVVLSAFLSSFPSSEASHFKSRHVKEKIKHTKHSGDHSRGHKEHSKNNRFKRDESFFLDEEIGTKIALESKSGSVDVFPGSQRKSRKKRGIFAWPPDTLFITEFAMEIPLYAPQGVAIPFIVEVPYEFDLPNITDVLLNGEAAQSEKRSLDERMTFYNTIESLFTRFGFDGHSCMLKAVCERAETDILSHGLLGEVLNLILAVSTTNSDSNSLIEYMDAEYHGKSVGDCSDKYFSCPISVFHFFDS